jgi:hypothetical protein
VRVWLHRPVAWAPPTASLAALLLALGWAAVEGIGPPADEGAPARLFQLLILADAVLIALFACLWVPRAPRPAAVIIAIQMACAAVPVALVLVLESLA